MLKKLLAISLGLVISAACLIWLAIKIDLNQLLDLLDTIEPEYCLLAMACWATSLLVRCLRWRVLLSHIKKCRVGRLYSAALIGYMANNLLPFRLGELVRAYAAARIEQIPAPASLGSLVVERVLDGLTVCGLTFVALFSIDPVGESQLITPDLLMKSAIVLGLIFLGVLTLVICLLIWPHRFHNLATGLIGRLHQGLAQKIGKMLYDIILGFKGIGSPKRLAELVFYSLVTWSLLLLYTLVLLPAAGLPFDFSMALLALCSTSLGVAVPSAPGFIGTLHVALVGALAMLGVSLEQAALYAMTFWSLAYFPVIAAGLFELWRRGLSFGFPALTARVQEPDCIIIND